MADTRTPQTIHLTDYRPPDYRIDHVDLHFDLDPQCTRVCATMRVIRQDHADPEAPLVLHGHDLALESLSVEGRELADGDWSREGERLLIPGVPERFELRVVNTVRPEANTALEGLYTSGGKLCTQCEPEGFRRITWFIDRPDVLARYDVTLVADAARYPVLLANGNRVDGGEFEDGRHWARWRDPFPKPSYLFALVAGDLERVTDTFTTVSGRDVALHLYTEAHNIDRCDHALAALKKAMAWDEQAYGREYDLDLYMVVAVDDFNMGAMENKGLNIFNSQCVLARPDTATDADYESIEAIIGHEYFHNWSGNRVTCRDWFQLSLKEGFTVFREQQFVATTGSAAVRRIDSVNRLRAAQFPEDAGPTAHPVRPSEYMEINNFYTPTVYEKGAEVVGMLHQRLGAEGFRHGSDRYFERFDGQAVTVEDFLAAMEEANGVDLGHFRLWYSQAGTPHVRVTCHHDAEHGTADLVIHQWTPATPGQSHKEPLPIPLAMGLLTADGEPVPLRLDGEDQAAGTSRVLLLRHEEERFRFIDVPSAPVPSLLRGFSAPVVVHYDYTDAELARLMSHDEDPFNRWEAGQRLARHHLLVEARRAAAGEEPRLPEVVREAFARSLETATADPALAARLLTLPDEGQLGEWMEPLDPDAIHRTREAMRVALGRELRSQWWALHEHTRRREPYRFEPEAVARRSLAGIALAYLMAAPAGEAPDPEALAACRAHYDSADNMTDSLAALRVLAASGTAEGEAALADFEARWRDDPLVLDKWFALQAGSSLEGGVERVRQLMAHPAFDLGNPNKVRAVLGAFAMRNPAVFHRADGTGYALLGEMIAELDGRNPQIAARLVKPLTRWERMEPGRAGLMHAELERLAGAVESPDVTEMVSRGLAREAEEEVAQARPA
ncbi:MAG: aminopeptidase N [Pseudomonadota bacterium]